MSSQEKFFSISEFSAMTGVKRKNLIFYDESGLLPPARVGANGYRYYSARQFYDIYLIRALRDMGFGLKEIKSALTGRTPEWVKDLLDAQESAIDAEIAGLRGNLALIKVYQRMLAEAETLDEERVELVERREEPVFFGETIRYSPETDLTEEIKEFYARAGDFGVKVGYPLCTEIPEESLRAHEWSRPRRYYCRTEPYNGGKEAGLYAIAHRRGGNNPGAVGSFYRNLLAYLEIHGLSIGGSAYEEHLIDAIAVSGEENFVTRVEVRVEKS